MILFQTEEKVTNDGCHYFSCENGTSTMWANIYAMVPNAIDIEGNTTSSNEWTHLFCILKDETE